MSFIKESKNAYKKVQENHIAIAMGKMLDDEGGMILNQLEELERAIEMIRTYVGTDYEKQLPAWVQAKVTLATDYISTVGNYLSSKNEKVTEEAIKEEFDLKETSLTAIHKMKEDGKTSEEIAKELKLNAGLVKKILGEEVELKEFTDAQIAQLKKEFDPLKGKQLSTARANQLSNILDKLDDGSLDKLKSSLIPFVSALAAAKTTQRKFRGVKITNIKVPGLEGMAEEATFWWHDGKTGYVKAGYDNKELLAWLKKNGYKPEKDIKEENQYVAVHVKKGKTSVTANSSYEAAKKASEKFGLNGTTGITVMLDKKDGEDVIHKATEETELQEKPKVKKQKDQTNNIPQNIEPTNASGANTQVGLSMGEEVELKPVPSLEDSAKKHNVDIEALKKQLEKGIKSESEHTDDPKIAEKIALAHLDERPDYYDQLDKMEKLPVKDIEEHIVKVKSGYELKSKSTGKNLGTYPTKAGAEKRERQVQYFKHQHEEVKEPTGELKDACWTGYVAVGTKMKNGKRVPNCVPKSEAYKGAKSVVEKAWKKLKEKK